jgi:hypothetical protein
MILAFALFFVQRHYNFPQKTLAFCFWVALEDTSLITKHYYFVKGPVLLNI